MIKSFKNWGDLSKLKSFGVEFISEDDKITFKFPKKIIYQNYQGKNAERETIIEVKTEIIESVEAFLTYDKDNSSNINNHISIKIFQFDGTEIEFDFFKENQNIKVYKNGKIIFDGNIEIQT